MASTQPVKNLGGGGFTFEDNVGAWLAAAMLVGAPPLEPELGAPIRIDFQVDADGWRLDDVLITFTTARCCGSIKSFPQVANGRAPADFVKRVWEDILGVSKAGFDIDADRVAMITAPLDITARRDLQELIRLARAQDPADLAARIAVDGYDSESKRILFDSFAQPAGLSVPDTATIESSAGEVLSRLRLIEADFEYSPSRAHEQALGWCRSALVEDSQVLGLWEALLEIVAEHRPAGGRITTTLLVSRKRRAGCCAIPQRAPRPHLLEAAAGSGRASVLGIPAARRPGRREQEHARGTCAASVLANVPVPVPADSRR